MTCVKRSMLPIHVPCYVTNPNLPTLDIDAEADFTLTEMNGRIREHLAGNLDGNGCIHLPDPNGVFNARWVVR